MSGWFWSGSTADEPIDKATSELLPAGAEDIVLNLEICDQIRAKTIPAKDAIRALRRRMNHQNPNVQLLTLGLTDTCVKNGGDLFLTEVASRDFMDNLVSILKAPASNNDVNTKILRTIQNWALAFEGRPALSYVGTVYKDLQREGYSFPPKDPVASAAMVDTATAPEWIDSDVCLRCRTAFSFTNRKHHCRNCGQVFDQACSSKSLPLPHFGITQDVRVCDACFQKLTRTKTKSHSVDASSRRHNHASRALEDAELQRAIQLSLQEIGAATSHARPGYVPSYEQPQQRWQPSEPPLVDRKTHPAYSSSDSKSAADEEDDPDLRAAIQASLLEASAPRPSAPMDTPTPRHEPSAYPWGGPNQIQHSQSYPPAHVPAAPQVPALPNHDLSLHESDALLTFNQTVSALQSSNRGAEVSQYPAVRELYSHASALGPKLDRSIDDTGRKEQLLEEMNTKLSMAVRLYDQLLTQRVQSPAWSQQTQTTGYVPPPPVQQLPTQQPVQYQQTGYASYQQQQQPLQYQQTGYLPQQQQQQYGQWQAPPQPVMSPPPVIYQQAQHAQYVAPPPQSAAPLLTQPLASQPTAPVPAPPTPYETRPQSVASSVSLPSAQAPAPSSPYQTRAPLSQVASPPPPAQPSHVPAPPIHVQAPHMPSAPAHQVPVFPSAPTAAPMFTYAPEPTPTPQKEAALIEL